MIYEGATRVAIACFASWGFLTAFGSGTVVRLSTGAAESFNSNTATTASYLVRNWRSPDGLPQNTVRAIAQTDDGYLWVGTQGGLARFDGMQFTHFGLANGLKGQAVVDLLEDGQGGLWIATFGGGLGRFHEGRITTYTTAEGLAHNNALALAPAGPGAVWVGGTGGLQRWDAHGFTTITEREGLPGGEIVDLAADHGNGLWIAVAHEGLFHWRNGHCERVNGPDGRERLPGHTLLVDSENALWFSIGNGKLLRRHNSKWTEYNESSGLPFSFIFCLTEGLPGEIWAGSHRKGLYVFRNGRFHAVTGSNGPLESSIRSVFASRDGLVWVGTQAGGLIRLAQPRLKEYAIRPDGEHGRVNGLVEAPPGRFWATTYGDGLYHGNWDRMERIEGVMSLDTMPFLLAGLRMSDGRVYFGGPRMLLRVAPETMTFHDLGHTDNVTALCEMPDNVLWMGTREGELKRLIGDRVQPVDNGKFPGLISGLVGEPPSPLWLSTWGGGLFRWTAGERRQWTVREGLPTNVLCTLHRDPEGTLWIGTAGGGLAWLRDDRLEHINTRQGLGADFILQIVDDGAGNLWLGSHRGIIRVAKTELAEVAAGRRAMVHPLVLDEADGMTIAECTGSFSPAGLRDRSGHLYFSTVRGVVAVEPSRFDVSADPPPVRIETVSLDGSPLPVSAEPLRLPPGPREVEIRYTAFNYLKPGQIRFRHRLDGLDSRWMNAGRQRSARFPLLPPGNYAFEVQAADADGRWTETGAGLTFVVSPFYWQATWFRVIVLLLGAGLIASGVNYVLHHKFKRQLAQTERERAIERERIRIAQDLHDEVGSGLTQLTLLGELARQESLRPEQIRREVSTLTEHSRALVKSLDEVVWTVNPRNDTLSALATYVCNFAQTYFRPTPIRCRLDVRMDGFREQPGRPVVPLAAPTRHSLLLAVKEALRNAARHSGAAEVWLRIHTDDGELRLTIEDDGHGFDREPLAEDRNGLRNMRARLEAVGGRCEIDSTPGRGTAVRLILPLATPASSASRTRQNSPH